MSSGIQLPQKPERKPPVPSRFVSIKEERDETDLPKTPIKSGETSTSQIEQLQKSFGTNWEKPNIDTLTNWIWIGAHNIKMINLAIMQKRFILRINAMVGILISTLTGTLSASQYNNVSQNNYYIMIFTILSFIVAGFNGYMKIAQIQETLEEFIKIKQQWVFFTTLIFSEFQLPVHLRQDALFLIWKYKGQYLDLLKIDLDINPYLRSRAENMLQTYLNRFDTTETKEGKLKRFNNFLLILLDMPKEVGFSTQLPNLMLDAILFNDSKMVRKQTMMSKSTTPNNETTSHQHSSSQESDSSGSSIISGETIDVYDTTNTIQINRNGTIDASITIGKK
jgi:hypothetical protein